MRIPLREYCEKHLLGRDAWCPDGTVHVMHVDIYISSLRYPRIYLGPRFTAHLAFQDELLLSRTFERTAGRCVDG
jgi:hypothetical protein